jgi:hypothetical protein
MQRLRPRANAIITPNFKFEDMGIGGLDAEFGQIFRRAFASRVFPPGLVDRLGIQHVKGRSAPSAFLRIDRDSASATNTCYSKVYCSMDLRGLERL